MLVNLAQRSDLTVEQQIQVSQTLYEHSTPRSKSEQLATQMLVNLAQCSYLTVEQQIQVGLCLWTDIFSATQRGKQILSDLVQSPDLTLEQEELILAPLYNVVNTDLEEERLKKIFSPAYSNLMRRSDLTTEQQRQVSLRIYNSIFSTPTSRQKAGQTLLNLALHPDTSIEEQMNTTRILSRILEDFDDPKTLNLVIQMSINFIQRNNLAFEQVLLIVQPIDKISFNTDMSGKKFSQFLMDLNEHNVLSIEQQVLVARYVYNHNNPKSKLARYATQILSSLVQRSDLSIEQELQVAEVFNRFSGTELINFQPKNKTILLLVQHTDLSVDKRLFYLKNLYNRNSLRNEERAEIIRLLWQIAQDQALALNQRLQAMNVFLSADNNDYINKTQAVRLVTSLLQDNLAKQYFEEHLRFRSFVDIQTKQLLFLVELVQQELLPSEIRNEMYKALRKMVPEFDKIAISDSGKN